MADVPLHTRPLVTPTDADLLLGDDSAPTAQTATFNVGEVLNLRVRSSMSAAAWSSANPTLPSGIVGFESDTGRHKVGTGSPWSLTDYASSYVIESTWPGRPLSGLTDGQLGDFSASFGKSAPFFRWSTAISDWIPMGPLCLGHFGQSDAFSTVGADSEVVAGATKFGFEVPAGLLRPGSKLSVEVLGNVTTAGTLQKRFKVKAHTALGSASGTEIHRTVQTGLGLTPLDSAMFVIAPASFWWANPFTADYRGQGLTSNGNMTSINNASVSLFLNLCQEIEATGSGTMRVERASCWYFPGKA